MCAALQVHAVDVPGATRLCVRRGPGYPDELPHIYIENPALLPPVRQQIARLLIKASRHAASLE